MSFSVAVVGATGAVGESLLSTLEERAFPVEQLYPLASSRSAGKRVEFAGESLKVEELAGFDFSRVQLALFAVNAAVSAQYAPQAAEAGCVVIDHSAAFRDQEEVPLVVPEVNPNAISSPARVPPPSRWRWC
jgi:aspartate-semialdehyde dehydrogenase